MTDVDGLGAGDGLSAGEELLVVGLVRTRAGWGGIRSIACTLRGSTLSLMIFRGRSSDLIFFSCVRGRFGGRGAFIVPVDSRGVVGVGVECV